MGEPLCDDSATVTTSPLPADFRGVFVPFLEPFATVHVVIKRAAGDREVEVADQTAGTVTHGRIVAFACDGLVVGLAFGRAVTMRGGDHATEAARFVGCDCGRCCAVERVRSVVRACLLLELTRLRGHSILAVTSGRGARVGSSVEVSGRVPA